MDLPRVILKPRRARPFYGMHPWVFAGAVDRVEGDPADGAVVDLVSSADNFVARGLWNSRSKIRVRLYSWSEAVPLDEAFFRARLTKAIGLRRNELGLGSPGQACRLVFSESDGLSGLSVDQYDRWLVAQFTSLGMAQRRDMLGKLLQELTGAEGVYLRTERGIGQLEGLDLADGPLIGQVPEEPIVIQEHGVRFLIHVPEGQKTGFYLDQRDNRQIAAQLAKGKRVLDAFCYSGGFGLHAAQAGAREVVGVDVSEPALKLARANAELNGLTNLRFEKAHVFEFLDQQVQAGEKYGMVVLDPPKFARAANAIDEALRGYRQLKTQALRLLEDGGFMVMCCCSGLITRENLLEQLAQVAAEGRRHVQVLEVRGPAPDHPSSATCPETNYLKCLVCRVG